MGNPGAGWKSYTGSGTPTLAQVPGNVGDFCVRTADGEVFQQVGGVWVDQLWSLQGAQTPYFCHVWRTTAHNGSNAGTGYVNLASDAVIADPNNSYSIPAQNYTCPVAGRYRVKGQCRYSAISTYAAISIFYNGSLAIEGVVQGAAGGVVVDGTVTCNAGDKLAVCVYHGSTASALERCETSATTGCRSSSCLRRLSSSTNSKASQARAYRNAAFTTGAGVSAAKIPLDTVAYDAGQNFQIANGRYICSVGGYYQIDATASFVPGAVAAVLQVAIFKNGVQAAVGAESYWTYQASNTYGFTVADVIQCNPGDYLELWAYTSGNVPLQIGAAFTFMSVSLVGTQPTAAPANAARARRAAALTPAADTWTKIPLDTIDTDPGGNVSVANGRYVCPMAGIYDVMASACLSASGTGSYTTVGVAIYKNGSIYSNSVSVPAVQTQVQVELQDKIQCNAGDYLEMWCITSQALAINAQRSRHVLCRVAAHGRASAAPGHGPAGRPGLRRDQSTGRSATSSPTRRTASSGIWKSGRLMSTHKWQFVGGQMFRDIDRNESARAALMSAIHDATDRWSPVAGDYKVEFGAGAAATALGVALMSPATITRNIAQITAQSASGYSSIDDPGIVCATSRSRRCCGSSHRRPEPGTLRTIHAPDGRSDWDSDDTHRTVQRRRRSGVVTLYDYGEDDVSDSFQNRVNVDEGRRQRARARRTTKATRGCTKNRGLRRGRGQSRRGQRRVHRVQGSGAACSAAAARRSPRR